MPKFVAMPRGVLSTQYGEIAVFRLSSVAVAQMHLPIFMPDSLIKPPAPRICLFGVLLKEISLKGQFPPKFPNLGMYQM